MFHRQLGAVIRVLVLAGMVYPGRVRAQHPAEVVLTGRVLDRADSVALHHVFVRIESDQDAGFARTDSAGRFVLRAKVTQGLHIVNFDNGYYLTLSQNVAIAGDKVDLGVVLLERGPPPLELMIVPDCKLVSKRPARLQPGMWLQRMDDLRGRRTLFLCDGLLRDPRVSAER